MTSLKRKHDFRIAVNRYPGVKFFQEIDPPSKPELRAIGEPQFTCYNMKTEVPILAGDKVWDYHSHFHRKLNSGRRKHNPARFLSVLLVDRKTFHIAFCNMHMQQHPNQTDYNHRLWYSYFEQAQDIMAGLWSSGYTLVYGGDLNKIRPEPYFSGQKTLVHHGLDHLYVKPARGVSATVLDRWVNRNMNSDHALIGAKLRLSK
jgi:hypothetical protein